MGSGAFPSGPGPGSPCASVSPPPGPIRLLQVPWCCPRSHQEGPQGGAVLGGSRQHVPKSCSLPSLRLLLPGRQLPLQPWPPLALGPFGWCPGLWIHRGLSQLLHSLPTKCSSCLGTPAASLGCSQDSQSPPVLLLGPCKGELHARVCPLLSILTQHLRSPPCSSPTPAGPPAVQLHPDSASLEVVSVTQVEGSVPPDRAPHLRRQAQPQFGSPVLPISLLYKRRSLGSCPQVRFTCCSNSGRDCAY